MKVLMINVVCGIRSTGRICTNLAAALEKKGHDVKIAYGREDVPSEFQKYAVRIGSTIDVKLHGVKARVMDGCGFGSRKATVDFVKWIREYDPDVIHLHNIHGYYINIEALFNYLRTCGKRIIWTLHDCWAFTGHTAYCDAIGCEKWKDGCGNCPQIREYPKSLIDRSKRNWRLKKKILTGVPNLKIVTPSKWLAGLVKESFLKDYPIEVIYNGIDTTQFRRLENNFKEYYGITDKKMLLGVATAWDENKGLSDYLRLASEIGDDYRVVLVGLTEEQKKCLPDSILGITRTNSIEELAQIYSAADFYINLSYCESFSMTNVEAQLCETPVITYASGGCVETAGKEGVVVGKGDISAVVQAIKSGSTAFRKDLECYSYSNSLEKYMLLMQQIAE